MLKFAENARVGLNPGVEWSIEEYWIAGFVVSGTMGLDEREPTADQRKRFQP